MEHEVPDMEMIIIKRGHPHEDHPHGGAWKVAFADFMTAMMAFFLVLWIVNSTNKETRSSVARYFNPVRISDTTAARKGLKDPRESDFDASNASDEPPRAAPPSAGSKTGEGQARGGNGAQGANGGDASVSFDSITSRDPFIALDELAGRAEGASAAEARTIIAELEVQTDGLAPFRDPFAPPAPVLPPESKPLVRVVTKPAPPNTALQAPAKGRGVRPAGDAEAVEAQQVSERLREEAAKAERAPASESKDAKSTQPITGAAQQAVAEAAMLRDGISKVLREAGLGQGPKLEVRMVDEGILISLTDDLNFGMFAVGSAEPQPRVVRAMERIGELLSAQVGSFVVRGHTDSRAYKSRAYDNWRLSSARAQMAAYMLMRGKLDEKRIERVEGHADRSLRNTADPLAAENRRIEILLRRAK
jgi:chemotaxis protein MotB